MDDQNVRTRNPEQTVERLTDAALSLFGRYGYERTTIDKIVRRAGYSKGAFYSHFDSKEEFFFYLLKERVRKNQKRIQLLHGQEEHPGKWLRSLVVSLLSTAQEDRRWATLSVEFMVQGMRDERLGSQLALLHQDWRRLIVDKLRQSEAFRAGRMSSRPETVAAAVVAMIDGFIIQASMEPDLLADAEIDRYVDDLLGIGEDHEESR